MWFFPSQARQTIPVPVVTSQRPVAGIGSTIMGIALMIGMLVTPYAETAFGHPDRWIWGSIWGFGDWALRDRFGDLGIWGSGDLGIDLGIGHLIIAL